VSDLNLPPIQGDLFSGTKVVRRQFSTTGATVELRLRPLGSGRVRIEEAFRKSRDAKEFTVWDGEIGRELAFEQLGLADSYDDLFGSA
jgi:hypothetical protein